MGLGRIGSALVALAASLLGGVALAQNTAPQTATPQPAQSAAKPGTMLLTVFLKHDQAKNLDEINEQLRKNGYYEKFPPDGVEVDSWYVVMGIGQIVTLRFPVERLREINRVLEQTAWGPYRTEFFPTYDYKSVAESQRRQMRQPQ